MGPPEPEELRRLETWMELAGRSERPTAARLRKITSVVIMQ